MASDISILSASDAEAWSSFLGSKLTEDKYGCTVRMQPVPVSGASEDSTVDSTDTNAHREAQVQILIVSPDLIDILEQSASNEGSDVDYHYLYPRPSRALAVYCGCDPEDSEVSDILNAQLKNFPKWAKCSAGQEEGEVNMVLATILRVLEADDSNGTDSGFPEEDIYLIPPLPRTVGEQTFRIVPKHITTVGEELYILFQETVKSPVVVEINFETPVEVPAKEETPSTFSFILPDNLPSGESLDVTVFCDGHSVGRVTVPIESKLDCLNRLLSAVSNPVELMAQALGLSTTLGDVSALDLKLKEIFQTNCPAGDFKGVFDLSNQGGILGRKSEKTIPTVLHLAARFGLKELCAELLSCPGAVQVFTVENVDGDLPNAIAAQHGHEELAKFLTDYKNTGVPIAMVFDEMISAKRMKSDPSRVSMKEESPPEPCHGGSYYDSSRQSIYMDMTAASNKRDSRSSTSSTEARSSLSNTSSVPPRPVSSHRSSTTRNRASNQETVPSSADARSPVDRPPLAPPGPEQSTSRVPELSPLHPAGADTPPPIKPRSDHSPKLPPRPHVDRARSSPHFHSVGRISPDDLKQRPRSDSDVSSGSSADGVKVMTTPSESQPAAEQSSAPVPFTPASAKDISNVSVTSISKKDQALRSILQSAAEGMVSLEEAQTLVKNWDQQYRKSQSFSEKWDTMKSFQPSPQTEPEFVKPRKRSESFFSKVFKRKTKTSESLPEKPVHQMKKKVSAPAMLYPGIPSTTETDQRSSVKSRLGPAAGDHSHKDLPTEGFQRTNSIRVARALEDRDISNLPDLPKRSPVHGATLSANRPIVGKGFSTGNLAMKEAPQKTVSRRSYACQPYVPGRTAGFSSTSPRLPDPDNRPPTGS